MDCHTMKKSDKKSKVLRTKTYINLLRHASPKYRKQLLAASPSKIVRLLSELCLNIAAKRCALPKRGVSKLRKFKRVVKQLGKGRKGVTGNRKILVQHGNGAFVPLLLTTAASLLPTVIDSIISRSKEK